MVCCKALDPSIHVDATWYKQPVSNNLEDQDSRYTSQRLWDCVLTGKSQIYYAMAPPWILTFQARPMDAQAELDLESFNAMLTLETLCHLPLAVYDHFQWCCSMPCPLGGPTVNGVCRCHGVYVWSSRMIRTDGLCLRAFTWMPGSRALQLNWILH